MLFLLVKTHNKTGLKYLCKHFGTRKSCFKYVGSGKYWKQHLKKHGRNITTNILIETDSINEFSMFGVAYSKLWDIVKSNEWANLCVENGKHGPITRGEQHPMYGKKHS